MFYSRVMTCLLRLDATSVFKRQPADDRRQLDASHALVIRQYWFNSVTFSRKKVFVWNDLSKPIIFSVIKITNFCLKCLCKSCIYLLFLVGLARPGRWFLLHRWSRFGGLRLRHWSRSCVLSSVVQYQDRGGAFLSRLWKVRPTPSPCRLSHPPHQVHHRGTDVHVVFIRRQRLRSTKWRSNLEKPQGLALASSPQWLRQPRSESKSLGPRYHQVGRDAVV